MITSELVLCFSFLLFGLSSSWYDISENLNYFLIYIHEFLSS